MGAFKRALVLGVYPTAGGNVLGRDVVKFTIVLYVSISKHFKDTDKISITYRYATRFLEGVLQYFAAISQLKRSNQKNGTAVFCGEIVKQIVRIMDQLAGGNSGHNGNELCSSCRLKPLHCVHQ